MSNDRLLFMCYRALVIKGLTAEADMLMRDADNNDRLSELVESYCKQYL